jgi:hypothetical protein
MGGDAVAEPTGRWNAHMMRVYSCGISGAQSTRPAAQHAPCQPQHHSSLKRLASLSSAHALATTEADTPSTPDG